MVSIGAPAAPRLVKDAVGNDIYRIHDAQVILKRIGKPALPAIRARWADLNDIQRWNLMPVFEEHDRESVREYAWNCLGGDERAATLAWSYMMRQKEPRAKDRYFRALLGLEDREERMLSIRWHLLPGEKPIYDEEKENDILIELLKPTSWVAKGKGRDLLDSRAPPWWPDGRPLVVETLRLRKAENAAPQLLKLLQEKGQGQGYIAQEIVPALVTFEHREAILELERIATSKPQSGNLNDRHPWYPFLVTIRRSMCWQTKRLKGFAKHNADLRVLDFQLRGLR